METLTLICFCILAIAYWKVFLCIMFVYTSFRLAVSSRCAECGRLHIFHKVFRSDDEGLYFVCECNNKIILKWYQVIGA